MELVKSDLHVHSPYSRANSRESTLAGLSGWAKLKGIQLVGSGDFTHPGWFANLMESLEPAEPGWNHQCVAPGEFGSAKGRAALFSG